MKKLLTSGFLLALLDNACNYSVEYSSLYNFLLGFELTVDHPHTHVVRITQLVRGNYSPVCTVYYLSVQYTILYYVCVYD